MITDRIKKDRIFFVIAAALLFGAFLHFRNLDGVIYIDEDEARAFGLLNSGPLIYLMCSPIFNLFHHVQKYVFVFAGLLGMTSTFLFYAVCRQLGFDRKVSAVSVLLYAIYPLRINYARTLYPAVFIEFWFMLSLFFVILGLNKKRPWLIVLGGFFCACIFFTHYFGYAIILGILVFALSYMIFHKKEFRGPDIFGIFGGFAAGFAAGYLLLDVILIKVGNGYEYTHKMLSCRDVELDYAKWVREVPIFLKDLSIRATHSPGWVFVSVVLLCACAFFIARAFVEKRTKEIALFLMFFSGSVVFIMFAHFGLHSIKERHFVWLSSLFSLSTAVSLDTLCKSVKGLAKNAILACALIFACVLVIESYRITRQTFRITVIRSWLEKSYIPKGQLITSWWPLNFLGDKESTSEIPGYFTTKGEIKDPSLWYRNSPKFVIVWPVLLEGYRRGLCRYMLTSGISARFTEGEGEVWLKNVKPMMSWMHPYSEFQDRPFYIKSNVFINLYDLNDVFSRDNARFVSNLGRGTGPDK